MSYCDTCIHHDVCGVEGVDDEATTYCADRIEPCENAISREDALMALTGEWTEITDEIIHRFIKRIKALPPVNPQPKTGHWIKNAEEYQRIDPPYICDKCGNASLRATPYCEQCGAWMESEEQDADSD